MRNVHGKAYYLLCCVCVCVWGSSCFCAFILLMPHRMQIYMKRAQCEFMFFFCWCSLLHSTTCIMLEHNTYIYKTHIFCHVCGVCFFLGGVVVGEVVVVSTRLKVVQLVCAGRSGVARCYEMLLCETCKQFAHIKYKVVYYTGQVACVLNYCVGCAGANAVHH